MIHDLRVRLNCFLILTYLLLIVACKQEALVSPHVGDPPELLSSTSSASGDPANRAVEISSVALSPDGNSVAIGSSTGLMLYSILDSTELWHRDSTNGLRIDTVAINSDGSEIATGSRDGIVLIWQVTDGESTYAIQGFELGVTSLAFHPSKERLAIGLWGGSIAIWDLDTKQTSRAVIEKKPVYDMGLQETMVRWSPVGTRLAAAGRDELIEVWATDSGELLATLENSDYVDSIAWSPDGTLIAASSTSSVSIWNTRTWILERTFDAQSINSEAVGGGPQRSLAWSPDGNFVALGAQDGQILVWDVSLGKLLFKLEGHDQSVHSLIWFEDRLLSASYDDRIILWRVQTQESLWCFGC